MSYLGNEPIIGPNTRDKLVGTGVQVAFALSRIPSQADGILVVISGVLQDSSTYSVAAKVLTFSEAPPVPSPGVATNIEVIYLGRQGAPLTANWNVPIANNTGTADALVATLNPAITSYVDNGIVDIVLPSANTIINPTVNVNGLGVVNILNQDGTAIGVGQLVGTIRLRYTLSTTNFRVLSALTAPTPPAGDRSFRIPNTQWVSDNATSRIFTITATVAANALTLGDPSLTADFRSPTLSSGAVLTRIVTGLTLVVPSTATLGTISAIQSRLLLLAIDATSVGGSVELAVVNISGGNNLDETTLITTTAISAAATSATVVYSTTARTSVPFRVLGYVESTQATAGTWATAPSTIQGQGGQALATLSSLGYGQTWQNLTASRAISTNYYNTTGRPITVSIYGTAATAGGLAIFSINGLSPVYGASGYSGGAATSIIAVVPPGAFYSFAIAGGGGTISFWHELR